MPRLPSLDESSNPELARVFAEIASSRGWVSNVMRALAHSPEGLRRFAALGDYARYRTRLSDRQREIVILITGRGVPYAWTHHEPLGRQAGLTEEEVGSIHAGCVPDSFGGQDALHWRALHSNWRAEGLFRPAASLPRSKCSRLETS